MATNTTVMYARTETLDEVSAALDDDRDGRPED